MENNNKIWHTDMYSPSIISLETRNEVIKFIQTIPYDERHRVTSETILKGVNNQNSKNYNFYEFEEFMGTFLGAKKVGTTKAEHVRPDGYLQ